MAVPETSVNGEDLSVYPSVPMARTPQTARFFVELWVDQDWYDEQDAKDPCPPEGYVRTLDIHGPMLIGRRSIQRHILPDVDCGDDTGVSRKHAELRFDGQRCWLTDLGSSNGTFLQDPEDDPQYLPDLPLEPGQPYEVVNGCIVYLGAWTRMVIYDRTMLPPQH